MSVARGFGLNGKSIYMNIAKPMLVECSFQVDSTNAAGVASLKSNGYIQNVFMASGSPSSSNPNPGSGIVQVQFKNNFNKFLGLDSSIISTSQTATKIDNSALTAGQVYVISTLGNATLAKWQAIGVPVGITPAVGVSFIALTNGGAGNTLTSRVMIPKVSGISKIELFGDPDVMTVSNIGVNNGQYLHAQFLAPVFTGSALAAHSHALLLKDAAVADGATTRVNAGTNLLGANTGSDITVAGGGANGGVQTASAGTPAGTMSLVATAPQDGSIVKLGFWFDGSSVTVDGL